MDKKSVMMEVGEPACLHQLACDRCFCRFNELFEAIENFLRLAETAKKEGLMISPNAFTLNDLRKAFKDGFCLTEKSKKEVWGRIQKRLYSTAQDGGKGEK